MHFFLLKDYYIEINARIDTISGCDIKPYYLVGSHVDFSRECFQTSHSWNARLECDDGMVWSDTGSTEKVIECSCEIDDRMQWAALGGECVGRAKYDVYVYIMVMSISTYVIRSERLIHHGF